MEIFHLEVINQKYLDSKYGNDRSWFKEFDEYFSSLEFAKEAAEKHSGQKIKWVGGKNHKRTDRIGDFSYEIHKISLTK